MRAFAVPRPGPRVRVGLRVCGWTGAAALGTTLVVALGVLGGLEAARSLG